QRVASGYEDGAVIPTVGLDKSLEVPVIQYRETDWEFLKRMASWCGGVVVPETHYAYPRIWFGFPDRAFTCVFPEDCYTSGISQRYYELGGPAAGNRRADFFYYDVPSSQMCDLGWYTVFRGQEFLICEKWAKLERGELLFTYRLGKPGLGYGRKEYNDKISGMTILGEVLSTKRETVCLKLDIDQGWAPGGPYPYTWRPETGNMMYCMPQVGTRVSLYFPNYDEQAAIAVNCVRTNGASCARMSDPSRRSFVTEHGKEMNLYPQEMSFLGGANGTVKLEDETGITISTDKRIQIVAQQAVQVNGETVAISAPAGELVLAKGDALSGSVESSVIQSNQYDLLAALHTHMEGWNQQTFEAYDDAPQEGSFDWGGLIINILGAACVVAFVVAVTVSTFGVGAAVTAGIAGGMAIMGRAVYDIERGEVSSSGEYFFTAFVGTCVGAISGFYGSMFLSSASGVVSTAVNRLIHIFLNPNPLIIFRFALSEAQGTFAIGVLSSIAVGFLDNYEKIAPEEIVGWSIVSGILSIPVAKLPGMLRKVLEKYMTRHLEIQKLFGMSNRELAQRIRQGILQSVSSDEIKALYGLRNPNDLARAIRDKPKELAKLIVDSIIENGGSLYHITREELFDVAEELATYFLSEIASHIKEKNSEENNSSDLGEE
ncbi:hypothetical protein, partial [Intestinimonas butyriciproducens]|uniref:hypothetical protein n=1 Tax=Intestinimonas butyriciproducens TaxID=1297617 RepID=UPI0031F87525